MQKWIAAWPTASKDYAEKVFRTFTEQVGYPVIMITVSDDRRSFTATQKRFLLNANDTGSDASLVYAVPITYTTNITTDFTSTTPKFYLDNSTSSRHTETVGTPFSWVVANIQQTGYYRVNYDTKSWHQIHHALLSNNWSGIHKLNRAQIVDDLLNLARAGEIEYSLAMDVLEYLGTEIDYLPWTSAFNGLSYIAIRLGTETKDFGRYILSQTNKAYNLLGFVETTSDSSLEIYNRAKILAWSCKYGNDDCISKAKTYFNNMKISIAANPVPVNIRSVVYCTAMREGNDADFDFLFKKYQAETVATEETLILNSLGCVKNQNLVKKYYEIIISDQVRRQDKSAALSSLYTENNENVEYVFDLIAADVDALQRA